jgi:hypothetical protein
VFGDDPHILRAVEISVGTYNSTSRIDLRAALLSSFGSPLSSRASPRTGRIPMRNDYGAAPLPSGPEPR